MRDGREVVTTEYVSRLRYNVYDCPHGDHPILTADVDEGVTPMLMQCPDHDATTSSRGYRIGVPLPHLFPVRALWRRPTRGEMKRERREGGGHYARPASWHPLAGQPTTAGRAGPVGSAPAVC